MSDKKQVEELAEAIFQNCNCGIWFSEAEKIAKFVVEEQGYRKQREGRWVQNEDHNAYESPYFCSECLADCSDIQGENYCYNCGVYMKGGVDSGAK